MRTRSCAPWSASSSFNEAAGADPADADEDPEQWKGYTLLQ